MYDALVELLRRTRVAPPARWRVAAVREGGDKEGGGDEGCARMGAVERWMLLAVLERAWLGA